MKHEIGWKSADGYLEILVRPGHQNVEININLKMPTPTRAELVDLGVWIVAHQQDIES